MSVVEKVDVKPAAGKTSFDDEDVNFEEAVAADSAGPADGGWASNSGWVETNNEVEEAQEENWASWCRCYKTFFVRNLQILIKS